MFKSKDAIRRLALPIMLRFMDGKRLMVSSHGEEGATITQRENSSTTEAEQKTRLAESGSAGKYEQAPDNDEPEKSRIRQFIYRSKLVRFFRALKNKIRPEPTAEEIRLKEKEILRRKVENLRMIEIDRCRTLIINRLIALGFRYETVRNERRYIDGPRFDIGVATDNEIILRCTHYPVGSQNNIQNMADDAVVTALSESIGHPVSAKYVKGEEKFGLRYFVAISGADGLPSIYSYAEMVKDVPSTAAPLALPFGVRPNGLPLFIDLAGAPHLLGAGSTGGGKTNLFHTWICTLISRNSPGVVQLDLLDFKDQGLEFAFYEGLPHLRLGKVLSDPNDLAEYFKSVTAEMDKRYKLLKAKGYRKISDYNRRRKEGRIPFLVIFADEWAQVVNTLGRDEADKVLNKIASQGRAAGIHLAVFTQYPKSDVISTVVTSNMSVRIAFYLPTQDQSRVVLQSGRAHTDLTSDQHGRAIVMRGGHEYMTQTALITDRQIRQIVAAAKEGTAISDIGIAIDPEEIIRWAMTNNFNKLTFESVRAAFDDRNIPRDDLFAIVKAMDNQEFEIDGTLYVVRNIGGSVGRRVELAQADELSKAGADDAIEPNAVNRTQEFRDALRAVLAAHEVEYYKDEDGNWFKGYKILIRLDMFTISKFEFPEPNDEYRATEKDFMDDLKALCTRYNAAPTDGGFMLEGETVTL
jgi:hypothetical protein